MTTTTNTCYMDPELGKKACDVELPAERPKRSKSKRPCYIAFAFVALVLLSLVELLVLPLRSVGAADGWRSARRASSRIKTALVHSFGRAARSNGVQTTHGCVWLAPIVGAHV